MLCGGCVCRLYTHVLNRHHWMYSATAYNHAYGDSGIFCINASAHPNQLADLVQVRSQAFFCFLVKFFYLLH